MSKLLKIVFGVVFVLVIAVASVFLLTSGMKDTADDFFNAIKQKDLSKARSYLAEDFKASTDEAALESFLTKGAILNFKEASWSNRQISGGRGELNGSITTVTGGVVPLKMVFVKENDTWKIYAIQKPTAGLQTEESSPSIPTKSEQLALVTLSMHDFLFSVGEKDMEHFRSTLSGLWQKEVTTSQLNQAFKSIIDSDSNWSVLENVRPVITSEAKVNDNGVLLLTGYYPTKPAQIHFEQKYIYEGVAWKLVGFNFQTK